MISKRSCKNIYNLFNLLTAGRDIFYYQQTLTLKCLVATTGHTYLNKAAAKGCRFA